MNQVIKMFDESVDLISKNRISEGKSQLEKLVICNKYNTNALNLLAICEYLYCNFGEAKKYINKSISIDSKNEKTIKYKKVIEEAFDNNLVLNYKTIIEEIKNENITDIQIEALEEINKNNEELIEPYIILALIYIQTGKYIKARKTIKEGYNREKSNYTLNKIYLGLKL